MRPSKMLKSEGFLGRFDHPNKLKVGDLQHMIFHRIIIYLLVRNKLNRLLTSCSWMHGPVARHMIKRRACVTIWSII
jgi:hypothetical protein